MSISLTIHRKKRIRRANAADIGRMVYLEHYWVPDALKEILRRVEVLNHEDAVESLLAAESALQILKRIHSPPPDLESLALAVYASALRYNGRLSEAIETLNRAEAIEGTTRSGQGDVLARKAVTLVCLGQLEVALESIDKAVSLCSGEAPIRAARSWIRMIAGDFEGTLQDCLQILQDPKIMSRTDYTALSAIVNAANVLSYEAGPKVEPSILDRIHEAIAQSRQALPTKGSGYYRGQRSRLLLSRAEALILARTDDPERALSILRRTTQGLQKKYPDDALDASIDLMCLLAKSGEHDLAVAETKTILELIDRIPVKPPPLALAILKASAKRSSLNAMAAAELRIRLRSRA